jgi:importin-5
LQLFADTNQESTWRHLALEVIVTLAETAPAMLRKVGGKYIPVLVPQVLLMMTDLDEDAEWSVADEILEEDNDRYSLLLDQLPFYHGNQLIANIFCLDKNLK